MTSASPALAGIVDALWDVHVPDPRLARRLQATTLPSPGLHIVLCYGEELGISVGDGRWSALRSHVTGPSQDSHRIRADGVAGVLAVHLGELGARGFVAGPMRAFAQRRTALSEVIPPVLVRDIEGRLRRCASAAGRSALAQDWVARWIRPPGRPGAMDHAYRRLRSDGEVRIADLAREVGVSERTLQRQFARHCGLSPKKLALSVRLRHAVALSRGTASWAQIALLCGFSDQAHLNRAFLAVFGQTPGQFRALHGDASLQPPSGPNATGPGDTAIAVSSAAG